MDKTHLLLIIQQYVPSESEEFVEKSDYPNSKEDKPVSKPVSKEYFVGFAHKILVETVSDAVKEIAKDIVINVSRASVDFNPVSGVYTIINAVSFNLIRNVTYSLTFQIMIKCPKIKASLCKQINNYCHSKERLKGYQVKIGIHDVDDIVDLCKVYKK